jgi:hypothetical protein
MSFFLKVAANYIVSRSYSTFFHYFRVWQPPDVCGFCCNDWYLNMVAQAVLFLVFSGLKVISFSGKTKGREEKARSQKAEVGSSKPEAGSQEPGAKCCEPRTTNHKLTNPLNIPPCGRVKNPSIGLRQPIEKTPRLFLTRFFADFFIE